MSFDDTFLVEIDSPASPCKYSVSTERWKTVFNTPTFEPLMIIITKPTISLQKTYEPLLFSEDETVEPDQEGSVLTSTASKKGFNPPRNPVLQRACHPLLLLQILKIINPFPRVCKDSVSSITE